MRLPGSFGAIDPESFRRAVEEVFGLQEEGNLEGLVRKSLAMSQRLGFWNKFRLPAFA